MLLCFCLNIQGSAPHTSITQTLWMGECATGWGWVRALGKGRQAICCFYNTWCKLMTQLLVCMALFECVCVTVCVTVCVCKAPCVCPCVFAFTCTFPCVAVCVPACLLSRWREKRRFGIRVYHPDRQRDCACDWVQAQVSSVVAYRNNDFIRDYLVSASIQILFQIPSTSHLSSWMWRAALVTVLKLSPCIFVWKCDSLAQACSVIMFLFVPFGHIRGVVWGVSFADLGESEK